MQNLTYDGGRRSSLNTSFRRGWAGVAGWTLIVFNGVRMDGVLGAEPNCWNLSGELTEGLKSAMTRWEAVYDELKRESIVR